MKRLKILDWPSKKFYSETHPFYKWANHLSESGIKVEIYSDHRDKRLRDSDYLIIHSRYFEEGWQNIFKRTTENEDELISFLIEIKKTTGKLIWFDAADSTGSNDFKIIYLVDTFLKKQVLKNLNYYSEGKDLRIWLKSNCLKEVPNTFIPCPKDQIHKIKLGWNIGLNDYRYFPYKLSRLSNYLSYKIYPYRFSKPDKDRPFDLTFRGTVHYGEDLKNSVTFQRYSILQLFNHLDLNIASGPSISKYRYWKEMRNSKLSISPFGWGEICYRDFETFISGAILIKPSMEHLRTYPNVFVSNETYIPVSWDLTDLQEKLELVAGNFSYYNQVAQNGQQEYKKTINDVETFINSVKHMIN